MRKITKAKKAKGKADRLFSQLVRARGACEKCGERDYSKLQTAHIISRRYSATRTDPRNAWCLCARCHLRLTDHPDEHVVFTLETIGSEVFDELKAKALAGIDGSSQVYWESEVVSLQGLLAEVEAA